MSFFKKVEKPHKKAAIDYTSQWSKFARRKPRYNRMDPDPDSDSDYDNTQAFYILSEDDDDLTKDKLGKSSHHLNQISSTIHYDREGNIKKILTKDDWQKFWVDRIRRKTNIEHLSDKDIADAVDRSRRIFLNQREADSKPHIDPDLPSCYYWDKVAVAQWTETLNLPDYIPIKEIILANEISGRRLITLDASTLIKLGIYELPSVKLITKEIRKLLGIPPPNSIRAMGRAVPLEKYLHLKVSTGVTIDKLTFKEFCLNEAVDYEGAKIQMKEGYKPMPESCAVLIVPTNEKDVKWIAQSRGEGKIDSAHSSEDSLLNLVDSDGSLHYLFDVPTVEELCNNSIVRNAIIPQIINEIVDRVYAHVSLTDESEEKQYMADEAFKAYMATVYSDFSVFDSEDRLKFITVIAEELADDITKARAVLEDIEQFQSRTKTEEIEEESKNVQNAVSHYVQSIMPLVVKAALKELQESSQALDKENSDYDDDGAGTFYENHYNSDAAATSASLQNRSRTSTRSKTLSSGKSRTTTGGSRKTTSKSNVTSRNRNTNTKTKSSYQRRQNDDMEVLYRGSADHNSIGGANSFYRF